MKIKKKINFSLLLIFTVFLSSCKEYLQFEFDRAVSGFKFSLVLGIIAIIIYAISGSNKER